MVGKVVGGVVDLATAQAASVHLRSHTCAHHTHLHPHTCTHTLVPTHLHPHMLNLELAVKKIAVLSCLGLWEILFEEWAVCCLVVKGEPP